MLAVPATPGSMRRPLVQPGAGTAWLTAVGGGLVESSSGLVDKSSDLVSSARESLGDMAARTVKSVGVLTTQVSRSLLLLIRSISWSL